MTDKDADNIQHRFAQQPHKTPEKEKKTPILNIKCLHVTLFITTFAV